jgi:cell division transport system ATP-binding protein
MVKGWLKKDEKALIELNQVALRYGDSPDILKDVTFKMEAGDFRFLTGASGAGKSTLLRLLFLALRPSRGQALIFGEDVAAVTSRMLPIIRRKLGVVFQDFRLVGHLSVFDNVALPLRVTGQKPSDYQRDVIDLLDWVGLKAKALNLPETLSGGEKQRVAIARAVVSKPEILLADEPTGNVDPAMAKRLLHLFLELNRLGTTVLFATHDEQLIAETKGKILRLENGIVREL